MGNLTKDHRRDVRYQEPRHDKGVSDWFLTYTRCFIEANLSAALAFWILMASARKQESQVRIWTGCIHTASRRRCYLTLQGMFGMPNRRIDHTACLCSKMVDMFKEKGRPEFMSELLRLSPHCMSGRAQ